jgi:hypothetical protein
MSYWGYGNAYANWGNIGYGNWYNSRSYGWNYPTHAYNGSYYPSHSWTPSSHYPSWGYTYGTFPYYNHDDHARRSRIGTELSVSRADADFGLRGSLRRLACDQNVDYYLRRW